MSWKTFASFVVLGDPKGQPRPRAMAFGGKARVYDPGTAEGWKGLVALAARPHLPTAPLEGPVRVSTIFYFKRPGRLLTKSAPAGLIPHTAKPDADNAIKAVLDSLTLVGMWRDDAQVMSLVVEKHYAERNQAPGALIQISTWEEIA